MVLLLFTLNIASAAVLRTRHAARVEVCSTEVERKFMEQRECWMILLFSVLLNDHDHYNLALSPKHGDSHLHFRWTIYQHEWWHTFFFFSFVFFIRVTFLQTNFLNYSQFAFTIWRRNRTNRWERRRRLIDSNLITRLLTQQKLYCYFCCCCCCCCCLTRDERALRATPKKQQKWPTKQRVNSKWPKRRNCTDTHIECSLSSSQK